jgi:hypothetical protein
MVVLSECEINNLCVSNRLRGSTPTAPTTMRSPLGLKQINRLGVRRRRQRSDPSVYVRQLLSRYLGSGRGHDASGLANVCREAFKCARKPHQAGADSAFGRIAVARVTSVGHEGLLSVLGIPGTRGGSSSRGLRSRRSRAEHGTQQRRGENEYVMKGFHRLASCRLGRLRDSIKKCRLALFYHRQRTLDGRRQILGIFDWALGVPAHRLG